MRLLIVGGSDAGVSAALRAKAVAPGAEVRLITDQAYVSLSICGLPYLVGGEVPDWRSLGHHDLHEFRSQGVDLILNRRVISIQPEAKSLCVSGPGGTIEHKGYDRLIIATGAVSVRPDIPGLDLPGVFTLRWLEDAQAIMDHLAAATPRHVTILGAGYIGVEMAEALSRRGFPTTVIEAAPSVLPNFDRELGAIVQEELERHGIGVVTGQEVRALEPRSGWLVVLGKDRVLRATDLVVAALGVRPAVDLAAAAGVRLGGRGAIEVDRRMATSVSDIFAAGDCAETWHRLLGRNAYLPLGTTAHKQGRVAGENAVGGQVEFQGTVGTQVVTMFDLVAARTGLLEREAAAEGFSPRSVRVEVSDHNPYYPKPHELAIVMTGDRATGQLLGAQIVGHRDAQVPKRIDILAVALHHSMRIAELLDLDLSYSPPVSSPWDPVQKAAMAWLG